MASFPTYAPSDAASRDLPATSTASKQAYQILRFAFIVAPIVAGFDKFTRFLVDWDQYAPPFATQLLGGNTRLFMQGAGLVEIAAGLGVAFMPRIFSHVVAAWLAMITLSLVIMPGYDDIALRDLGLTLAALALGRLSMEHSKT